MSTESVTDVIGNLTPPENYLDLHQNRNLILNGRTVDTSELTIIYYHKWSFIIRKLKTTNKRSIYLLLAKVLTLILYSNRSN